jgi:hypothetical protein
MCCVRHANNYSFVFTNLIWWKIVKLSSVKQYLFAFLFSDEQNVII